MNRFLRTAMAGLCLVLMLGAAVPAQAQPTRTLTIRDGKVWIDAQLVPADSLPPSLNLQGVEARLSFTGDARPSLEIGGVLYVLDERRLRQVAGLRDDEDGVFVLFRDGAYTPYRIGQDRSIRQYTRALQAHSEELAKLSREAERARNDQFIEQARVQAQQAAQVAQSIPLLEVESYLSEVQEQNQALYDLLLQEWQMEAQAQALAHDIQRLPENSRDRQQRIEALRTRLDAMFEMKQENRRREIQQLERQLEALRERLQIREQYRERIIQQRLQELIGVKPALQDR